DGIEDLPEQIRIERSTHIFRIKAALQQRSSAHLRVAMIDLMGQMEGLSRQDTSREIEIERP
ncbi:MAG: hypothetical protein ACC642_10565, partial [Pseudomonadales bacterium]